MITGQVDNYNLNKPPPVVEEPVVENETKEEPVVEEPVVEENELEIQPIEKDDIFEKPKEQIINTNKPKKKREMSEKQKAHLQKLIEKNKQRALEKKEKELEKQRKKEEKKKLRLEKLKEKNKLKITEKKVGKTVLKPVEEVQQENNFVNELRKVDSNKSQSRNNYYNDMEKMFGLFTRFQEKNEEIINKRVEQELLKRTKTSRRNLYDNEEYVRREHPPRRAPPPQPQRLNRQESSTYKIDFSQYSHGSGYNKGNPYGF